ncbi:hypothetical protein CsSME_00051254 [Camellia sinensis var. sinensis]
MRVEDKTKKKKAKKKKKMNNTHWNSLCLRHRHRRRRRKGMVGSPSPLCFYVASCYCVAQLIRLGQK